MFTSRYNIITFHEAVKTSDSAIAFLQEHKILRTTAPCSKCGIENSRIVKKSGTNYHYFPCDNCATMTSIRNKTFLAHKHTGLRTFCMILYTFVMLQGLSIAQKIHEVGFHHLFFSSPFVPLL